MVKRYFITGLMILLPLVLTIALIVFVFNLLTKPFAGAVAGILRHYGLIDTHFLFLSAEQFQQFAAQVLVFLALVSFTILLGAVARWFFVHYLLKTWDYLLHRIPFIRSVYKTCQEVIRTIFTSSTKSFKQVVMVPFPSPGSQTLGLVTKDDNPSLDKVLSGKIIVVFVPTTPNPTSGFLIAFQEEDLVFLDMSVEEAFKTIISCGVIMTPFNSITKEEAHHRIVSAEMHEEEREKM